MDDYFDSFPEEVTKWEIIRDIIDLDLEDGDSESKRSVPTVQLLPRQDVRVYGIIPKMEQKVYTKCKECMLVFNPRDIFLHKTCPGKMYPLSSSSPHNSKKKVKNKGSSSSKKSQSGLPPPPLFKKTSSQTTSSAVSPPVVLPDVVVAKTTSAGSPSSHTSSSKIESKLSSSNEGSKSNSVYLSKSSSKHSSRTDHSPKSSKTASTESSALSSSSSSNHSSSSSRHKKTRKSNSGSPKITKDFDPDIHCGVIESGKGPCTRSITCSNHRIQLRKLVPGRSKDIHQLIAERKTAKEKDTKHGSPSSASLSPNEEEVRDFFTPGISYVPLAATNANTTESASMPTSTFVPILPKSDDITSYSRQTTSFLNDKNANMTDTESKLLNVKDSDYIMDIHMRSQESKVGAVPVVYMPISPISVVSPTQDWKLNKEYYVCFLRCCKNRSLRCGLNHSKMEIGSISPPVTANTPLLLSVPSHHNSVKTYNSHPKPVAISTYSTKKVGGAILLSNQHIESQRNDILMAINTRRKNVNNSHGYRAISLLNNHTNNSPNILKVKSVKINCKRPALEKLNTTENKQIRLPNVNGFILHSDISETAEAPQSNNCIQEKIALLNMK